MSEMDNMLLSERAIEQGNQVAVTMILMGIMIILAMFLYAACRARRQSRRKRSRIREAMQNVSLDEDYDSLFTEDGPVGQGESPGGREVVISVENVSKLFRINDNEASGIKEYIIDLIKGRNNYHMLKALNKVSLDIRRGEVIGLIGTNGSGKSTLLKIISGAMPPTMGRVSVDRGKVQLLTLGTGFDSELTGRENVYLNGAIIGYSREFLDEKYDDIVAFAQLEGFMEEKIKNYSSGMVSRLGFAIATAGETAEILILDEVLSVGDMFFRRKSEKRIQELIHSGSTVIIVSHSTDVILKNCTRAVWLEKGVVRMIGEPGKVCEAYRGMSEEA